VHRAHETTKHASNIGIDLLWNVPYRPDLNGIEMVWGMAKASYRSIMLQQMLGAVQEKLIDVVCRIMDALDPTKVKKCAGEGQRRILQEGRQTETESV
jgi:hypothetical protein